MLENDFIKIILESNVLNFAVVLFLVVYFLPKTLKKSLDDKKVLLNKENLELEQQKIAFGEKLAKIEAKISSVKTDADSIISAAEEAAEVLKKQIIDSADLEIEKMKALAFKEIEDKKKLAFQEVETYFIQKALDSVEASFSSKLNTGEDIKHLAAFSSLASVDKS